jgi:hypothetical protein
MGFCKNRHEPLGFIPTRLIWTTKCLWTTLGESLYKLWNIYNESLFPHVFLSIK